MGKLTHTVKGPIASFRSADKADIESLKLHFLPKQEGSGDPSPTNIRPITGWTGCNLFKAKKNLFDDVLENGYITDGGVIGIDGYNFHSKLIRVTPGMKYTYSLTTHHSSTNNKRVHGYDIFGNWVQMIQKNTVNSAKRQSFTFTVPSNIYYIRVQFYGDHTFGDRDSEIQVECGEKASEYTSYEGSTIPLSWSDHGAEYGGYIDPVKGELVAEWIKYICTGNEALTKWYLYGSSGNIAAKFPRNLCSGYYSDGAKYAMCNFENSVSNIQMYYGYTTHGICISNGGYVTIQVDGITTLDAMSEWLAENKPEIIFRTDVPAHYPLTSQQIETFIDYNNFWTDMNDNTEVEYAFADRLSERKLIMDTPHIESASGAVASFSTDMKAPIVDLKAYFTPVQEGTGDPSPVNVRSIKGHTKAEVINNKKNFAKLSQEILNADRTQADITFHALSDSSVHIEGTATGDAFLTNGYFKGSKWLRLLKAGTYTLTSNFPNSIASGSVVYMYGYDVDGNNLGTFAQAYDTKDKTVFTLQKDSYVNIQMIVKSGATINHDVWVQIEKGSSKTAYEQHYDEVVPITFPATKNLFNAFNYVNNPGYGFVASEGCFNVDSVGSGNACIVRMGDTFQAGTYTLSAKCSGSGLDKFRLLCSSSSCGGTWNDYYNSYFIDPPDGVDHLTFTTNESFTIGIVFVVRYQHPNEPGRIYDIQLERGSTATKYEPYGTVYGGYIDLIREKLVAEYALACAKKSEFGDKVTPSSGGMEYRQTGNLYPRSEAGTTWSTARQQQRFNFGVIANPWSESSYGNNIGVLVTQDPINTTYLRISEVVYQAMGDDDYAMISYKLETPIEYDLTPEQIKTLKSINNIWSDANGNVEVSYWTH